ncbi:MAG: energy coupling factor transporter S component ThiW [Succiniclasticum sp.]|jgi:energy coupling factor transporter S component ThiW|nr:energy coupling factor transporter S component ThiW [Succiniclasticum sp.]MDY2870044.1 energy coupling factor transporter S component ThiW [Succiniclasticum sp.]
MEQRKEETARAGQGVEQAAVRSAGMTAAQQSDSRVYRLVVMAMLIGLGVVISPILRVEGMCPMAHLINITGAVLLGPWYSFVIAAIIGILRMTLMGIPPLALTGAVFGATLSGILYRLSGGRLWTAVVGEIIGTGLIGAMASYPVMTLLYGRTGLTWMFYVPSFIMGTLIGGTIAFFLLSALRRRGTLRAIQHKLGVQRLDRLPHA